ncbi:MAG: DoxX family protein [Planctomycetota bacterium]
MHPLLARVSASVEAISSRTEPTALLLTRLVFGQAFLVTGWGKLGNLAGITKFFEELGIPLASVQAPMVATIEFVGGILLLLGLGTRYVTLLLMSTMLVALATAHRGDFGPAFLLDKSFADVTPLPFLVGLLFVFARGSGPLAADRLLEQRR